MKKSISSEPERYALINSSNVQNIITTYLVSFLFSKYERSVFMISIYSLLIIIIIHQTHYEKSGWSRAFNQFTIACELDMIYVISAADITFNVCLVTKPLGVFSSETKWLNASLLFLRMNYVKNV